MEKDPRVPCATPQFCRRSCATAGWQIWTQLWLFLDLLLWKPNNVTTAHSFWVVWLGWEAEPCLCSLLSGIVRFVGQERTRGNSLRFTGKTAKQWELQHRIAFVPSAAGRGSHQDTARLQEPRTKEPLCRALSGNDAVHPGIILSVK